MSLLTDKITSITPPDPSDPENIFEDSLFALFGDARNQHGEPGEYVLYKSGLEKYGDIKLRLAEPAAGDTRFFAHFVWNAGLQAAEMIVTTGEFKVEGESVLELGAGAALPGIMAAKAGAKEVVCSDYPAREILDNISMNLKANLSPSDLSRAKVMGHVWGDTKDELSTAHPKFTRIIAADCMWMSHQNLNLCTSIRTLLDEDEGVCLAIAGFHTGREKVVGFFEHVAEVGLEIVGEAWEQDIEGKKRPWVVDRGREDPVERKRWLTIAFLRVKKEGR